MENTRIKINNFLETNLLDIKKVNGYNNDVGKIYQGIMTLEEVSDSDFPCLCYFYGEETRNTLNENSNQFLCEVELICVIHLEATNDIAKTGLLNKTAELGVADLLAFFNKSKLVTASCNFNRQLGVQRWFVNRVSQRFDEYLERNRISGAVSVSIKYHDKNQ